MIRYDFDELTRTVNNENGDYILYDDFLVKKEKYAKLLELSNQELLLLAGEMTSQEL